MCALQMQAEHGSTLDDDQVDLSIERYLTRQARGC